MQAFFARLADSEWGVVLLVAGFLLFKWYMLPRSWPKRAFVILSVAFLLIFLAPLAIDRIANPAYRDALYDTSMTLAVVLLFASFFIACYDLFRNNAWRS